MNDVTFPENGSTALTIDPERRAKGQEHGRTRRQWLAVELGVSLLLILAFWLTGGSRWLKALLVNAGLNHPWLLVGSYVALCFVGFTLLLEPLSWWQGYILPHRYDLSTQTLRGWLLDELKGLALGLALGVPVAEVIYWLLRSQPETWWLWAAGFLILFGVLLDMLAPVLLVPLFYTLTPLEDAALVARIQQLGNRAKTPVVGVYTIDLSRRTKAANALVMGLGKTKRIALGDTLYEAYTPAEIEGILAHELAHQVHHDLELGIVAQSALILSGLYLAHLLLHWGVARYGFAGPADVAALPLFILAMALFSLFTMPLTNAYSRWRERLADRFAAYLIDNPRVLANALVRLSNQNLADPDPPQWVVWLLHTHPPIKQRIEDVMGEQGS